MTSPTLAEHLYRTPALWINLDRSQDRAKHFRTNVAPWISQGRPLRVPGIDGSSLDPGGAVEWKRRARLLMREAQGFKPPNRPNGRPNRASVDRAQGLLGCELSHQRALIAALEHPSRPERFLVLEDDALIRWDLYSCVQLPDPLPEVIMWGGLVRSNHERDAEIPVDKHVWRPLHEVRHLSATHAYELTRPAAEHLLATLVSTRMHVDQGGIWPTLNAFRSVLSKPQVITTARFEFPSLTRGGRTLVR